MTIAAIAANVWTRRYRTTLDPLAERIGARDFEERRFVALGSERLEQRLAPRLHHVRLLVVMIDGIRFKDRRRGCAGLR